MRHYRDTIYYDDLNKDDFGDTKISLTELPKNYKYINSSISSSLIDFVLYRLIARPIAYLYNKIKFHQRIYGKLKLLKVSGGYFIYSNHTAYGLDAFTPNIISLFKKNYIVVGKDTASLTKILPLLRSLGAIPLSDRYSDMIKCIDTINKRSKFNSITIYPEAHIWPYYNDIRPFDSISFKYPVKLNKPIFCLTNCYQKRLFGKRPKVRTFIDGPYYPREDLGVRENAQYLRDIAYNKMKERCNKYSTFEYFNYVKKENSCK